MSYNTQLVITRSAVICCLLAVLLLSESCRKEGTLAESDLDENYFVIKDNPDDPADHAIFQFYTSTGIAAYYNDTIAKKKVGDTSGVPVYSYMTLSLSYGLFGNESIQFQRLSSKTPLPALLDLLKNDVVSRLPEDLLIPSILFLDSISYRPYPFFNVRLTDGTASLQGYNTVGIDVKDVESMTTEEKKMYAASILAGIALKTLNRLYPGELQRDFFSISRSKVNSLGVQTDIYNVLPLVGSFPSMNFPTPASIGFLRYNEADMLRLPIDIYKVVPPGEPEDVRIYAAHILYYSEQELNTKYVNDALVLKKLNLIREMLREAGFKLPV